MEEAMDRPKPGALEERSEPITAEGRRIRGVIPYGIESRDMGGWREVIEPTALRSTKLDDLVVTVDHAGVPLGRFPTTLELEDRADGMHWSVEPPKSRQDIVEAIERRDLRGGSFRMRVAKDEWRGDVRHVLEIAELRDVSIVTTGAYPAEAAQVELRSQPDPANGQEEAMADKADTKQDEKTEQTVPVGDEQRGLEVRDTGSLKVNERNDAPLFTTLADLYAQRGFFENRSASVTWDEFRAFTWSAGTVLTDLNPVRRAGVPLGYDTRWVYPALPQTAVSDATTSIQYLRQSARTLAGTASIRPLDATTTKPETASTVEYQTLQLNQVASVVTGVPRIHAAQPMFQSIIEQDLRLNISDNLDELVRRGISTAGTAAAVVGDVLQKIRRALTVVGTAGYNADVLAIDPAGAEALDLLQTVGTEKMYVFNAGAAGPAPYGLNVRVWKTAGTAVLDSQAFGRLYVSPLELRSFEADGGVSNKTNVRMETNAGFAVERLPAALRIL
jgi:HK97 family phage prohead protease